MSRRALRDSAHGAEHEAREDHDDGHRDGDAEVADDGVVERGERQREEHDAAEHVFHRQITLGGQHGAAYVRARGREAAAHAGENRAADGPERPDAADEHGADTEVADLRAANGGGRIGCAERPATAFGELRIAVEEIDRVDGDGDVPGDDAAARA